MRMSNVFNNKGNGGSVQNFEAESYVDSAGVKYVKFQGLNADGTTSGAPIYVNAASGAVATPASNSRTDDLYVVVQKYIALGDQATPGGEYVTGDIIIGVHTFEKNRGTSLVDHGGGYYYSLYTEAAITPGAELAPLETATAPNNVSYATQTITNAAFSPLSAIPATAMQATVRFVRASGATATIAAWVRYESSPPAAAQKGIPYYEEDVLFLDNREKITAFHARAEDGSFGTDIFVQYYSI